MARHVAGESDHDGGEAVHRGSDSGSPGARVRPRNGILFSGNGQLERMSTYSYKILHDHMMEKGDPH